MRVLSLCSGIGGLDLAAKAAFGGVTIGYVEIDPYCQAVLQARMRDGWLDSAPIWPDLRTFDGLAWCGAVDCIVAGFPCQPFSVAGSARGDGDERNLWPEVAATIRDVRPPVAFMENVPGLLHQPYWGTILGDLAALGYSARWDCIPAALAGAPHQRDRLWIIALHADALGRVHGEHVDGENELLRYEDWNRAKDIKGWEGWKRWLGETVQDGHWPEHDALLCRMDAGSQDWMDRIAALGNAVVPQQAVLAWRLLTEAVARESAKGA